METKTTQEQLDSVVAKHAAVHAAVGTTIHLRLENSVPFSQVEALMDAISTLVYGFDLDCFVSAGRPE